MYKEVAIDPACMADFEYYILLKREFGFEKGRYAAAEVKAWAKEAVQFAKKSDMRPVKQKSVKTFLNQVQKGKIPETFLLSNCREKIEGSSWDSWWQAQAADRSFSATVSETTKDCLNHDDILNGCREWDIPASIFVKRNSATNIVAALEPLLYLSKEVTLVDQYFRLIDNQTLVELFKLLSNYSVRKFTVVTSMDTANLNQEYRDNYKALNTQPFSFTWINAPEKFFHDRYLLSDIGALRAGHGFMTEVEKGAHADMVNINIISKEESERTYKDIKDVIDKGACVVDELES